MRRVCLMLFVFLSTFPVITCWVYAQQEEFLPIGLTEEEKTRLDEIGINHKVTAPPTGVVRNPAEWEPSEGVLVRWPLGIPVSLVAEMSEDVMVTTICANASQETSARSTYSSGGVNMTNVDFIHAPTDSIWVRDYGPWFIFDDLTLAITDHIYNRPRPNDDVIPQVIGTEWGLNVHGLDLEHTGGNHMSNGLGMSMSTELVYNENTDKTHAEVDQLMYDYLGNNYTVLDYIQSGGIHHIDCWAKFLSPKTIMVKDVPISDPTYDELNDRAAFLASQTSAWGVPYEVVRVYCPSGAYYTNSLILNDKVLIPLFGDPQDSVAIQTYENAMPGYEVLGFTGSWTTEDALHCRTMGVPDEGMLFIDHIPFRTEDITTGDYRIEATIVAHSGSALVSSELKIIYRVDGGFWVEVLLTPDVGPNEYYGYIPAQTEDSVISYYIKAADNSGRTETHPYIGAPWAHEFTAICMNHPMVDVSPDGSIPVCSGDGQLLTAVLTGGSGPYLYQWTEDGFDITGATDATYTATSSGTHTYNCKVWGDGCINYRTDVQDTELIWQVEPLFDGLQSVVNPQETTCALDLSWNAGIPACGGPINYSVYRDTASGFTPGLATLLVEGLTGTTYHDTIGLISGTTYYYIVRAIDTANGVDDGNLIELADAPTGPGGGTQTYLDEDFSGGIPGTWTIVDGGSGGGDAATWTTDNPGGRTPSAPITTPFAIVDSDEAGAAASQDEQMITHVLDLATTSTVTLEFDQHFDYYSGYGDEYGDVDVRSANTGGTWVNVFRNHGADSPNPDHQTLDISTEAAGASDVEIRFYYYGGQYDWYWMVDNILVTGVVDDPCSTASSVITVADGTETGTDPLQAVRNGNDITITWDAVTPNCTSPDYHLIWGWGSDLDIYGIYDSVCSVDSPGNHLWLSPPDTTSDFVWFLIVGSDGVSEEGGWGTDSSGIQRSLLPSGECSMLSITTTACQPS